MENKLHVYFNPQIETYDVKGSFKKQKLRKTYWSSDGFCGCERVGGSLCCNHGDRGRGSSMFMFIFC